MPTISIRLEDSPKLVFGLSQSLADLLREEAEGEPEFVRKKLESVAAKFEAGIRAAEREGGADDGD